MFFFLWTTLFLPFTLCFPLLSTPHDLPIREYFITAEEIDWNYAPMNWDNYRDQPLTKKPSSLYAVQKPNRIGSIYHKVAYRQYRDASFTVPIAHDSTLGLLGPVLRAESGDQLRIHFMNKAKYPHSLHPHHSNATTPLPPISPGASYTYVWDIPRDLEFPEHQSSIVWLYHSHSPADTNAGLLGFVIIYEKDTLVYASPGSMYPQPRGIDQEVYTIMTTTDEMKSTYFNESVDRVGWTQEHVDKIKDDFLFKESNRMYHINGFIYNNNQDIQLVYGSRVRWYVVSFGVADNDAHTAHWHGATLLHQGRRVDVVDLDAVSFEVLDMVPDNEGQWLFHCHVASHFEAGMSAFYQIDKVVYTGDEGWD